MASHSNNSSISTLSSIDPGMTSESSGSPTNSTESYGLTSAASPAFNQAVLDIINDHTLSDSTLREQAHKHLEVLTRGNFAKYNVPKWVERAKFPDGIDKLRFNMRLMFDAMYRTAEDLHLVSGTRYVSAAICACAARVTSDPKEHQPERLAAELSMLGGTWVAYMLWPFVSEGKRSQELSELDSASATPTIDATASEMGEGTRVGREALFRDKVRKRDNYTCVITGHIDKDAPQHIKSKKSKKNILEAAHIFKRSVSVFNKDTDSDKLRSLAATYDILKHYCELDVMTEAMSNMDSAQNGMLLQHDVHIAFDDFEFCFLADIEPNTYKIKQWVDENDIGAPTPIPTKVTFTDHSQQPFNPAVLQRSSPREHPRPRNGIALPSAKLLRLHAALASVLHLCGAADLLHIFNNPPGFSGPAIRTDYGEDFEHEVIQYNGPKISSMVELEEAVGHMHIGG